MAESRREGWLTSHINTGKTQTFSRNGIDAGRLESYWKHICEQENNSKKRNNSLMEDFERIEQQVSLLDTKTQKLKDLQDQYNSYINKMYPRWLDELKHHRHLMQQERNDLQYQASRNQVKRPEGLTQSTDHVEPREFGRGIGPGIRGSNHVRFISPEQSSLYQHQESSLYDSQQTRPQDQTSYYDQTSTQGYIDSTRYKTMDWDPYHRDPSFDYYHFGQLSSLRTPHGHMNQQPANVLRFSTPYYPGHSGPLDPRNGFNQSFDMSYLNRGYERGPHPRHPYGGSPMMNQSPGNLLYDENIRPAMPGQGTPLNPEAGVSYSMSYSEGDCPVRQPTQHQRSSSDREQNMSLTQSECNGSIHSPSTSPYARDPPEKPLELTANKRPVKPVFSEKKRPPQDPQLASSEEYTSPSPLDLSDLQPVSDCAAQANGQTDRGLLDASKNEGDVEDNEDDQLDLSEGSLSLSLGHTSGSDISLPDEGETKDIKTQETHTEDMTGKPLLTDKPGGLIHNVHGKDEMKRLSNSDKLQESVPQESHKERETKKQGAHNNVTRKPSLTGSLEHISKGAHGIKSEKDSSKKFSYKDEDDTMDSINTDQNTKVEGKKVLEVKQTTKHQEGQAKADTFPAESIPKGSTAQVTDTVNKKPSVTKQVLLTLLKVVDADIEVSFSPETIYRAPPCSQAMKEDIIRSAESDDNALDAYDPSSISMIVLEELPLLIRSSPSGCLIQDQVLLSGEAYLTPKQLRAIIEPSLVSLWDGLLPHMTKLVEQDVLAVDEAVNLFANLLLKQDSKCRQKFQSLLMTLIKGIISGEYGITSLTPTNDLAEPHNSSKIPQKDDSLSVASDESSTLGSTPPIYDKELPQSKKQPSDAPAHSLERTLSYENDFEEDDVPLNETAAYRKMMSSAQSTVDDLSDSEGKTDPKGEEESEGDDDLERTLARSISPPATSPIQRSSTNNKTTEEKKPGRQKPKLALFEGGAGSLGLSYGSEDLGDSLGGNESGRLSSSWKSNVSDKNASVVSDEDISPPSSPDLDLEPAYIPSAMDSGNKNEEPGKIASKTATKITRKAEFWNHSDTESEVDLQLSTGAADAEDDDFDFYG